MPCNIITRKISGDPLEHEDLLVEARSIRPGVVGPELAKVLDRAGDALLRDGVQFKKVAKHLGRATETLEALGRLERAFYGTIALGNAHRDPIFPIRDFLVDRYGLSPLAPHAHLAPVNEVRRLFLESAPRTPHITEWGGMTLRQARQEWMLRLDRLHETLVGYFPDLLIRDVAGDLVRAKEVIPFVGGIPSLVASPASPQAPVVEVVPAMWSDSSGRSDRPRFRTHLDPIVAASYAVITRYTDAANYFDRTLRKARLENHAEALAIARNGGEVTATCFERLQRLLLAIANQESVGKEDRRWYWPMMAELQELLPGVASVDRELLGGAWLAARNAGILWGDFVKVSYSLGLVMDAQNQSPLSSCPALLQVQPE